MLESRALIYEAMGIPIDKQLNIINSKWLLMHKVAIKKHEQKIEMMQLRRI